MELNSDLRIDLSMIISITEDFRLNKIIAQPWKKDISLNKCIKIPRLEFLHLPLLAIIHPIPGLKHM